MMWLKTTDRQINKQTREMSKRNDRERDKHILFVCLKMYCSLSMHVTCSKKNSIFFATGNIH